MYKNKTILRFCLFAFFIATLIPLSSCGPENDEPIQLSRLFRPGSFSRLVDGTNVSLSWVPIKNASYLIEYGRLAAGLPFDSVIDMQSIELVAGTTKCQLNDLWGSTRYGIRIKAVSQLEGTDDSRWVNSNFTTDAENIFYPIIYEPAGSDFTISVSWQTGKDVTHILVNNLQLGDKIFEISAEEQETCKKALITASDYRFRNGQLYTISIWNQERKRGENSITLQR